VATRASPPRMLSDRVGRRVAGMTATWRCCWAAKASTAAAPDTLDAATRLDRWWDMGSGEVGPYRKVVMMTDCSVIIWDCNDVCVITGTCQLCEGLEKVRIPSPTAN
jgi:hypothetical protein